ncbi:MAG: glycogen/starch/alpha-glucan phosphorylase [Bacillota bacterium]|jgi:starch phosphorylase|nr:glycogen/starch/alpha-glucan phosphorylase [Bacillota bacterium]
MTQRSINSNHIISLIDQTISSYWNIDSKNASTVQLYRALSIVIRDMLIRKYNAYKKKVDESQQKQVYYMCMEFLVGKSLKNNLFNLKLHKEAEEALKKYNVTLEQLYAIEKDAGLGNGGLGRLASCFMDSLATLSYPATGFSLKYEFGLFKQKIIDGWQTELPDDWLSSSDVWLVPRTENRVKVIFYGEIYEEWTHEGLKIHHLNATEIEAIPYDMMISGFDSEAVSLLRLWESRSIRSIDMNLFSQGDYIKALAEDAMGEAITKVLYPADNHDNGKILRIKQQYFLVSASAQNIVNDHLKKYCTLKNFSEKVSIHINDTHPALMIPELMRIFMDEYNYTWDDAWNIVVNTVSYTNHTVLQEALETIQEEAIKLVLPRIYMIISEINTRLIQEISYKYNGNYERINQMSIINKGLIHMANLCIAGSYSINGVAKLHTDILKQSVFRPFYEYNPYKFKNITNGITHRRWLVQANPDLNELLINLLGKDYYTKPEKLSFLKNYENDDSILNELEKIKQKNKKKLVDYIYKNNRIETDINSIFDIQVKRLHEYKRQLLNILKIISIIIDINEGKTVDLTKETFIFGAKAAPSYYKAKEIIQLICALSSYINKNQFIKEYINVVFIENYSVSSAEIIIPAGELSEQISLSGKEASGTGNMKLMLNGALTIGTYDGANIEILEQVKEENFFLFGLKDYEVEKLWKDGYNSIHYYQKNEKLRKIIDFLNKGIDGKSFESISKYLLGEFSVGDPYMCFADFDSYMGAHDKAVNIYFKNKRKWNQMSLINIASAGIFSSDRTIKQYSKEIWNLKQI